MENPSLSESPEEESFLKPSNNSEVFNRGGIPLLLTINVFASSKFFMLPPGGIVFYGIDGNVGN